MKHTTAKQWSRKCVSCGEKKLAVWPRHQEIITTREPVAGSSASLIRDYRCAVKRRPGV